MTSQTDIYAQTSSYQREERFLICFVEEYAVPVQGAKPRSQNPERCSRSGLFSGYFGLPQSRGHFASRGYTSRAWHSTPGRGRGAGWDLRWECSRHQVVAERRPGTDPEPSHLRGDDMPTAREKRPRPDLSL